MTRQANTKLYVRSMQASALRSLRSNSTRSFNSEKPGVMDADTIPMKGLSMIGSGQPNCQVTEVCETEAYDLMTFDDDDLVELQLLRDQEIDALAHQGLISKEDRWNPEHRLGFTFSYPEMALEISTGARYPVQPLTYLITNINLPRVVVDQLKVKLREIHALCRRLNTVDRWCERALSVSGSFEFEMNAFYIVVETVAHLKRYRSDPTYWRNRSNLRKTDYEFSLERRRILEDYYGINVLLPDPDDETDTFDPFNPDWSKKETDMTDEQKLNLSDVQHQCEIKDSMFGIDPSSVQGHDLANSILGKTPEEICAKIPETFRILHIESVVRSDLAGKFMRRQATIQKELAKLPLNILKGSIKRETRLDLGKRANEPETLIDLLTAPELTFHCTREDLVPSIVRQGFLKPREEKDIRCGATYGQSLPDQNSVSSPLF